MAEEKLYKIMEQNSTGWNLHSNEAQNLSKDDAEKIINRLLEFCLLYTSPSPRDS